jgi:hypothetical protein
MEAYVNGVSTRAVDDLVAAMGIDTGISKSQVSRICEGLDARVEAFRSRTLGHVALNALVSPSAGARRRRPANHSAGPRIAVLRDGLHR